MLVMKVRKGKASMNISKMFCHKIKPTSNNCVC